MHLPAPPSETLQNIWCFVANLPIIPSDQRIYFIIKEIWQCTQDPWGNGLWAYTARKGIQNPSTGWFDKDNSCLHETSNSIAGMAMFLALLALDCGYNHYIQNQSGHFHHLYHHQRMTYSPWFFTSLILVQICSRCVCLTTSASRRGALTAKKVGKNNYVAFFNSMAERGL